MSEQAREQAPASEAPEEIQRRAIDAALNYLSYRQRTAREVRRKLADRGFSDETIEAAMGRLSAVGLIDDEAFVSAYVRDRVTHRPMGVRRMAEELYVKGVAAEVARPVIEETLREEGTDERAMARRVAEKRARMLRRRREGPDLLRRRLREHLLRRGFGPQIIREVTDEEFPPD